MPQALRTLGRRLRQPFGISAPRMAVRTHLSWRWRVPALLGVIALTAAMWWWGFDFGQFLGEFNRASVAERRARTDAEGGTPKGKKRGVRRPLGEDGGGPN